MKRDYISIHNHTEFSNIKVIDSINRAPELIDYAWELNLGGLAITEHDCLSGVIKLIEAYRKKLDKEWEAAYPDKENVHDYEQMSKDLDFKVIIGNEIYLSEEGLCEGGYGHFWHLILLAKDEEGWKQLKQLSSAAWKRAWFRGILRTPTYPSDLFKFVKGGHLICSTACLGSYPAWCWKQIKMCRKGDWFLYYPEGGESEEYYLEKLDNHLAAMEELFGVGNFFIELQPNELGSEQNEYNEFMINRYKGQYPFVFSTDSHYMKEDLRQIHTDFLASKSSEDREITSFYKYAYMMSQEEVHSRMIDYMTEEFFEDMVKNTKYIGEQCHYYPLEQPKVIAKVEYEHYDEYESDLEVFNDVTADEYPYFYEYLHTDNRADHYFMELIAHGFINKYQESWDTEVYYKRLEEELWTIREVGNGINQSMSDYFTCMSKMVNLMWEAGSLVGPSRGSAGALLINYLLDITQIDPIFLDLPYVWRFMHPSRPDYPDIDVDSESDKRQAVFNKIRDYFRSIGGDVINVCTFGTEGTKSALKTAARGLNINLDEVAYVSSMVPNERGFDWSLHDCYYGNGDDRMPISAFKKEMDANPQWWKLAQSIEGLVTRLGVHASGVVCVNGDFIEHGSYMKTNSEQLVTAFDLHDQEKCALIKYDMLTVSALDRIHQCMNYMLETGDMEWKGSLKETYDYYINPNKLDYETPEMWDMAAQGKIRALFQFDTIVGGQSIKYIEPKNLQQLAIANSIMRLMAPEGEDQPIDIYVKYKRVPQLWYNDMKNAGLNDDEIKVLEKYLKVKNGVADSQEVVMQLSMDPQISGFSMKDANRLRKIIAKKNFKDIESMHEFYLESGAKLGTSKAMLNYVWDKQFKLSFGYSFSTIHTTGYSVIAVQEMNLAYHYPSIYWNCACLSVDSSAISAQDFYNLIDDGVIEVDEDEKKKVASKMDYSKIAAALSDFRNSTSILLPDVNKSRLSFTPDAEDNTILYGLKGITKVTDPAIEEIMMNRPFASLNDFLDRTTKKTVSSDKVLNLIKAGAFNEIEGKSTREVLTKYIDMTSDKKNRLTLQNANALIDRNLFPNELYKECEVYKLTKELRKHRTADKLWYRVDFSFPGEKEDIWREVFKASNPKIEYVDDAPVINSDAWDNYYDRNMDKLRVYIKNNSAELLEKLNNSLFQERWDKYCQGDELDWQLESLNFFFDGHPLSIAARELGIELTPLKYLEEDAQDGFFVIKGKEIPKMRLYSIAGTVIDSNTTKSTVTVQTPDGVITLKIFKSLYSIFDKVVYSADGMEIVQDSFFAKGTNLLITGIKRGSTFVPKVYKSTGRKAILKINLTEDRHFKSFEEKMEA